MRPSLEQQSTKETRERPYTRTELVKMRRRLLDDCLIYEKRAELTNTDPNEAYRASLEAMNQRIEAWIQKQLRHPERFQAIAVEQASSTRCPRGTISFLLQDGSCFSIQEPDPFLGYRYTRELIGNLFSCHAFLTEDASYQLTKVLSEERGVPHALKQTWEVSSIETPGAVLFQYNPSKLDAKISIKDGHLLFATKENPDVNPRFDDPRFSLKEALSIGKPIKHVLKKDGSPPPETYAS